MDPTQDRGGLEPTYRLLALCARAEGHPVFYDQLRVQLRAFHWWDDLPAQAERLGMAPLFWHHVQKASLSLPKETESTLRGLYLRQRALNRAHTVVLLEMQALFERAGIRAMLLKGLGLAHEYYPDPALRPVSDIDFLFQEADVLPALEVLAAAGFRVDSPAHTKRGSMPREPTADSPMRDGLSTHGELHHSNGRRTTADDELSGVDAAPQSLMIENHRILVPAPADTLHYLSRHLKRHLFEASALRPLQLKWAADMVSVAERHATELDWADIQRHHPDLLARLGVFYALTPMPEACVGLIPVKLRQPVYGLNQYPQGWPQHTWSDWRKVGLVRFLLRTFAAPSEWWLRLYHGISRRPNLWIGPVRHRMLILKLAFGALIRQVR